MRWRWRVAAFAVTWAACLVARAHDLVCSETVDGAAEVVVDHYPATVQVVVTVSNVNPSATSVVQSLSAPVLAAAGLSFTPAPPYSLGVGGSQGYLLDLVLASREDCLALAAGDGADDANVDSRVVVGFDSGEAQCTARIVCGVPACADTDGGVDVPE